MRLFLLSLFLLLGCSSIWGRLSPYGVGKVGTFPGGNDLGIYSYDSNGARIGDGKGEEIEYGLFMGKPTKLKKGIKEDSFRYGLGGSRYLREL